MSFYEEESKNEVGAASYWREPSSQCLPLMTWRPEWARGRRRHRLQSPERALFIKKLPTRLGRYEVEAGFERWPGFEWCDYKEPHNWRDPFTTATVVVSSALFRNEILRKPNVYQDFLGVKIIVLPYRERDTYLSMNNGKAGLQDSSLKTCQSSYIMEVPADTEDAAPNVKSLLATNKRPFSPPKEAMPSLPAGQITLFGDVSHQEENDKAPSLLATLRRRGIKVVSDGGIVCVSGNAELKATNNCVKALTSATNFDDLTAYLKRARASLRLILKLMDLLKPDWRRKYGEGEVLMHLSFSMATDVDSGTQALADYLLEKDFLMEETMVREMFL